LSSKVDIDALIAGLARDFIENSSDSLDVVDTVITELAVGNGGDFLELQRRVHSIKGGGGTFGFPAVTLIAHALEDYIETSGIASGGIDGIDGKTGSGDIGEKQLRAMQLYADAIRDILDKGVNPGDSETTDILRRLPANAQAIAFVDQTPRDIGFLLVMPKGLQRRIIGEELVSCGFRVNTAKNAVRAIEFGLANPPDIIAANMFIEDMTGIELARVFKTIDATSKAKFLLMTSSETIDAKTIGLPLNAKIVRKGNHFSEDLTEHLMAWGVFGDIGAGDAKPDFTAAGQAQDG